MSLLRRDESLTLTDRQELDGICLAFEDEWLAGRRPVVEGYLRQVPPARRSALLKELLLLELDYRRSLHEEPCREDYVARFPDAVASVEAAFQEACARAVPVRFLPGSWIGRYRVRRRLGSGAFAAVYLAWDEQLQREVAVKVPHPARLARLGSADQRQRLVDEARAVASLKHPHIVALYDAAELPDGTVYQVMQYVPGQSLRELLDRGAVPPDQGCRILADVSDAIAVAHRAGIIHRDLKPSNIVLDDLLQPHVCDFGLALSESQQCERRGEYAGTLSYMAPEQLRGEAHQLDGRADIWAVGVMLYELLTGRQPFQGRDRQELTEQILSRDPRPPRQIDPRIGRSVERVCLRCLARQPADRYATAADVAEDLRRALDHSACRRSPALYGGLLLLALLLVSAAVALWLHYAHPAGARILPLHGSLELTVWHPAHWQRQGVRLDDPQAMPLRPGDQVRLAIELNHPAYAYIVWLDAQGRPAPVHPWRGGNWQDLPAEILPVSGLTLPSEPDTGWEMRAPQSGMETLLLLARHSPLPADVSLRELLSTLPHTTIACRPHAVRFHAGRLLPVAQSRDALLDRPREIHDPLLQLHQELATRLRPHFELIHAVSFPVQGD